MIDWFNLTSAVRRKEMYKNLLFRFYGYSTCSVHAILNTKTGLHDVILKGVNKLARAARALHNN